MTNIKSEKYYSMHNGEKVEFIRIIPPGVGFNTSSDYIVETIEYKQNGEGTFVYDPVKKATSRFDEVIIKNWFITNKKKITRLPKDQKRREIVLKSIEERLGIHPGQVESNFANVYMRL